MCNCSSNCDCNITALTKGEKGDASSVSSLGYKVYVALLTQASTNAPTVAVLQNTTGVTPVWTYGSVGNYNITSASLFTANKTTVCLGQYPDALMSSLIQTTSLITVTSQDLSGGIPTAANGLMDSTYLEIRIYS